MPVSDAAIFTGLRVIITRPQAQAKPWQETLERHGMAAECVPAMVIEPISLEAEKQRVKNLILDFDHFQKAIFVSQNAVRYGLEWLNSYWPQLPEGVDYFAVGTSTARLLEADVIDVQAAHNGITSTANSAMNSEALLKLLDTTLLPSDKVIIFRGCGGRPFLGDELEARGCKVSYAELYHRLLPEQSTAELAALKLGDGDILSVHSGESLQNLLELLSRAQVSCWAQLPLLVPGARVAAMAAECGFDTIIQAENASDKSMYVALKRWCTARNITTEDMATTLHNAK